MYGEELCHFGIKGMRWGVRRYRNPDGTLTEAGKKRYGPDAKFTKRKASEMTDEELRKAIDRMNLEKNYRSLVSELHPDKMKRVKKMIADIAEQGVKTIANKAFTALAEKAFEKKKEEKKTDLSYKNVDEMSDDELARRIKRLNSEKTYAESYYKTADTKGSLEAEKRVRDNQEKLYRELMDEQDKLNNSRKRR